MLKKREENKNTKICDYLQGDGQRVLLGAAGRMWRKRRFSLPFLHDKRLKMEGTTFLKEVKYKFNSNLLWKTLCQSCFISCWTVTTAVLALALAESWRYLLRCPSTETGVQTGISKMNVFKFSFPERRILPLPEVSSAQSHICSCMK